jgi:fructose-1-phosphate kinase PfkB-like protein
VDQLWEATPPRIEAISPIGAGDAMAAALTWSLHNGDDFPEALSWGVATGSASAQLPGTQFATLDQAAQLHGDVDLRRVEG